MLAAITNIGVNLAAIVDALPFSPHLSFPPFPSFYMERRREGNGSSVLLRLCHVKLS